MNYGVPYRGSKSKIAKVIIDQMPPAENFYDLFAGGCAVTHAAILSGKYENVYCNDLDWRGPELFRRAINGEYENEKRWISREDFFRLKDEDPYVEICWSFGSGGENYMYAEELEPLKMWVHYLFFAETPREASLCWKAFLREFDNIKKECKRITAETETLCKECGTVPVYKKDGSIDAKKTKAEIFKVYSAEIRQYMRKALEDSGLSRKDVDKFLGTNGMAGHYFGDSQWMLPTSENYEKLKTIMPGLTIPWPELNEKLQRLESLERLKSLQSLESLERLQSLQSLESLERLKSLEGLKSIKGGCVPIITTKDYREVEIKPDSVIYCDIPYRGTEQYSVGDFNYKAFYNWARIQKEPVYISEYDMPEDFKEIWQKQVFVKYSSTSRQYKTEKLFKAA